MVWARHSYFFLYIYIHKRFSFCDANSAISLLCTLVVSCTWRWNSKDRIQEIKQSNHDWGDEDDMTGTMDVGIVLLFVQLLYPSPSMYKGKVMDKATTKTHPYAAGPLYRHVCGVIVPLSSTLISIRVVFWVKRWRWPERWIQWYRGGNIFSCGRNRGSMLPPNYVRKRITSLHV